MTTIRNDDAVDRVVPSLSLVLAPGESVEIPDEPEISVAPSADESTAAPKKGK
jgi:hypothetical protein